MWMWPLSLLGRRASDWAARGDRAAQAGKWRRAYAFYDRATAADPGFASGWVGRAHARLHLGEPLREALDDARKAVHAAPDAGWPRFALARILTWAHSYDDALLELKRAESDGDPILLRLTRAWILNRRGDIASAVSEYDAALALSPDSIEILGLRALALARVGRHADALADCDRVDGYLPRSIPSLTCRAYVLLELKDVPGARATADRAWAMDRKNVAAVEVLADVEFLEGNYLAAARILSELPYVGWNRYGRGAAAWALRRWEDAARDFEAAADLAGEDRELRDYAELRRWMSLQSLGTDERFETYLSRRYQGSEDEWYPTLARYMLGRADEEALFAAAQAGAFLAAPRVGQARFHVGIRRRRSGDLEGARAELRACLDSGIHRYYEYKLAHAELRDLPAKQ